LLATPSGNSPRRAVSGIDHARAAMIAAVLEKHARLRIAVNDVYLSTVGGMRLTDPSSDLAVAVALASAYVNLPLPATAVMIGEVGLAGDLRRVSGMERRLAEAARQGFTTALIPSGCDAVPPGLKTLQAPTIAAALEHVLDIAGHRDRAQLSPHRPDSALTEQNDW
jgi:DNA repair protein RadA/Sms